MAGSGPQRLAVDVPLVAAAAPFAIVRRPDGPAAAGGLSDLRLFDRSGREVPYLLVHPPPTAPEWIIGTALPIAVKEKTSGFEADLGAAAEVDAIGVDGLPAPFLKRLVLEGSGDRGHWTMLDAEGTLFDLPDERLRQLELPFRPGTYRYLRVTWDDTNSGRVPMPPRVSARRVSSSAPPPPLVAPLAVDRRPSEPGRSRYRVKLPGARLPIVALQLEVGGAGPVLREAAVSESRLTGGEAVPSRLGSATLRRAVRGGAAASELRIPIAAPVESELDLLIENGSNPPLDLTGMSAVFAELPWIYFDAPDGAVAARYGDAQARPPSYDLEAMRASIKLAALPEARWGDPRPLVEAAVAAPAPPMPAAGAPLDPGAFTFTRGIPDGSAQLVALALDAAALAHSRGPAGRFADVRVLDAAGQQIPYLVERRDEPLSLDVALRPYAPKSPELASRAGRNRSTYLVPLPYDALPAAVLALETPARVFHRAVQLGVETPPDRRHRDARYEAVATRVWQHADAQTVAPALALPFDGLLTKELILAVDEGDNSALPIRNVRILLPSYRLRFYRSAATGLRLAYGRVDLPPPQYDLALVAAQVLGADTREIAPGDEQAPAASGAAAALVSPRLFWVLLSVAVIVLLGLMAKLVRSEPAAERSEH